MNVLDLFSGIGGFSLGLERAGMRTVAFCEIDPYCRAVLRKHWPGVPIYDDVRELTAERLGADGIAPDVITAGFPCQDASVAQTSLGKRTGIDGARTGLWKHVARLAPYFPDAVFILENVPGILSSGVGRVFGDLARLGLDADWTSIPASAVGLPHRRDRIWIVAYPSGSRLSRHFQGQSIFESAAASFAKYDNNAARAWRALERDLTLLRGRDGISLAMERRRIGPLGNAVVPQIPEIIGRAIMSAQP